MKTQTLTVSWPWYGAGADDPAYKVEKIGNSTQFKPGQKLNEKQVDLLCKATKWNVTVVKSS